MTREDARKAAEVMLAYADGKQVEVRNLDSTWRKIDSPTFDWYSSEYRIKPQPTYRPFNNAEECWQEMQKHQPFGWLKDKTEEEFRLLSRVSAIGNGDIMTCYFEKYTFADGEPFGVKEEER